MNDISDQNGPRPGLLLLGVLVVVMAVYVAVLDGPFVWDDRPLILHSKVSDLEMPWWRWFLESFWTLGGNEGDYRTFYRPLTAMSYVLDYRLHGQNPAGFHVFNVVLHLFNAGLLFALLRLRSIRVALSALLALGWALLPRLTEDVAWISGRTDVLATSFAISGLLLWLSGDGWARRLLAALCVLGGLLSKEVALSAVVAICAYELVEFREHGTPGRDLRRVVQRLVPLFGALGVYAVLRLIARAAIVHPSDAAGPVEHLLLVLEAVGTYTWMLLDPWHPRLQIGNAYVRDMRWVALGALTTVLSVWLVVRWSHRRTTRLDAVGAAAATLSLSALLLVLQVVRLPMGVVAADRFLYLPTFGATLCIAPSIERWWPTRRWPWVIAGGLVASFAVATYLRVADWADEIRLWQTALHNAPNNELSRVEFGNVFMRAGLHREALSAYQVALRAVAPGSPTPPEVHEHIANGWSRLGRLPEARRISEGLAERYPKIARFQLNVALIDLQEARFSAARARFERALEITPRFQQAQQLLERLPEVEREFNELEQGASVAPLERARLFTRMGRLLPATHAWLTVLSEPGVPVEVAQEGMAFLLALAPHEALLKGTELYPRATGQPIDNTVSIALDERIALVERLRKIRDFLPADNGGDPHARKEN